MMSVTCAKTAAWRERANRTTRRDGTYQSAYLHLPSVSA